MPLLRRPRLFVSRVPAPIRLILLQREAGKACTVCRAGYGMAPFLGMRACARGEMEQVERSLAREPLNQAAIGGWGFHSRTNARARSCNITRAERRDTSTGASL